MSLKQLTEKIKGTPPGVWRIAGAMITAGTAGSVVGALSDFPSRRVLLLLAVVQGCVSAGWLCRSWTHERIGYFAREVTDDMGPMARRLRKLSIWNVTLGLMGLGSSIELYRSPNGGVQFLVALVLIACGWTLSVLIYESARARSLVRGSEWVRNRLYPHASDSDDNFIGKALKWLMDANTPPQKMSRCVTVFLTLLGVVVVLASPAPARSVLQIHSDDTAVEQSAAKGNGKDSAKDKGEGKKGAAGGRKYGAANTHGSSDGAGLTTTGPRGAPLEYDQYCREQGAPGEGMPAGDVRVDFERMWRKVGGFVASCAESARRVQGRPIYYVESYCAGQLRALGIAVPGSMPLMLLFGAAAFVLPRATDGRLRGVVHAESGDGDLVTVQTDDGTYALIRPHTVPNGAKEKRKKPYRCEDVPDTEAPYAELPPPALDLVIRNAREHGWAWPVSEATESGPQRWTLRRGSGDPYEEPVGTIICTDDRECVLRRSDGTEAPGEAGAAITMDQLSRRAPPPPAKTAGG